jgi:hypothetical protein
MWRKLYSNSGLILIAVLGIGVWVTAYQSTKVQAPSNTVVGSSPSPSGNDVRELGRRVKRKFPGAYDDLDDADLGRRVKAKYPGAYDDFVDTIPAPSPSPEGQTAEDRLRIWRQEQQSQPTPSLSPTLDVLELYKRENRSPVTGEVIGRQGSGATAVCRDGSYSYASNHRGACSHHGGVREWLR